MKSRIEEGGVRSRRPAVGILLAIALMTGSVLVRAQSVKAPPLPAGSTMVKAQPGMDDEEEKRQVRAHKNKFKKKDPTVDDSEDDSGKKDKDAKNNKGKKP